MKKCYCTEFDKLVRLNDHIKKILEKNQLPEPLENKLIKFQLDLGPAKFYLTTSTQFMKKCNAQDVDYCLKQLVQLNDHIHKIHEKVLWPECGLLFEKPRPIE